jgi:hypothetical protein
MLEYQFKIQMNLPFVEKPNLTRKRPSTFVKFLIFEVFLLKVRNIFVNQPQFLLPILDITLGEPSNFKKS